MYFFSQRGLKNLKILYDFLVLKSPFACSLQKPAMVVSFAEVTNAPTVNPLFSDCSSWPCKNSKICFINYLLWCLSPCPSRSPASASGTAISLFLVSSDIPTPPSLNPVLTSSSTVQPASSSTGPCCSRILAAFSAIA